MNKNNSKTKNENTVYSNKIPIQYNLFFLIIKGLMENWNFKTSDKTRHNNKGFKMGTQ